VVDEQPSLGQLIWLVRRELEWVHRVDAEHPLRFGVGSVELDVNVEVSQATKGDGGLDLKVFGIGGKASGSREANWGSTSRVHVVLTPQDLRTGDGHYEVSAADTEPPPRRADAVPDRSAEDGGAEDSQSVTGAVDTEPPRRP
jgi:NTP-dependent ternary system trypsin peptidase co-occuring protein